MGRLLVLSFLIILASASMAGYYFVTEMIISGGKQIADGQKRLEEGQPALEEGKARIAAGRRELSKGQEEYDRARENPFLVLVDRLLKGGKGFEDARRRIAEGLERIARGEDEIDSGTRLLGAGEIELQLGMAQLKRAKDVRVAFVLAASLFTFLSIFLGFRWRRSFPRIFKRRRS
ncbi:MAG TPA: hypothetical protein VLM75_14420 [Spirochaetota bacterium]|nr:hypothetical protein [Spirochaetota bacterium]